MKISTRGRYALRVVIDLAEQSNGKFIPMKEVAERQVLSAKYLEQILPILSKAHLIEGQHGKGGGYRLSKDPQEVTVWDVLTLTEGDLAPVVCLEKGAVECGQISSCRTIGMWQDFYKLVQEFFSGITIADLMQKPADEPILNYGYL